MSHRSRNARHGRLGATVAAAVLLATACDSGSTTTVGPDTSAGSSTPDLTTPAPSASSSVSPADRPTHCVDPVGDGHQGGDLTSVDVVAGADAVRVTWRTTIDMAVLARSTTAMYLGLDLTVPSAGPSQLGVTFVVKARDGVFSNPEAARVTNDGVTVDTPAAVAGSTLTATYPPDVLDGLGSRWKFRGSLDLAVNVDDCSD